MTKSIIVGDLFVSQCTALIDIRLRDNYDLILAALSWEARSASAFTKMDGPTSEITLFRFGSASAEADESKDAQLNAFATLRNPCRVVGLALSTLFQENAVLIASFLESETRKRGRPLRVLLDITCFPKAYTLFMLGFLFVRGDASRVDCLYTEGEYALDVSHAALAADAAAKMGIISEGDWSSLQVPYLEAESAIPASRDVFVVMGGEVGLSLPFLERYEPSRLGLVLIQESLVQKPEKLPQSEQRALAEILSEPNVLRSNVGIADLIGVVEIASRFCSVSSREVTTAIALGSKPHALGIGLVALAYPKMEVVCRVPKKYRPLNVASAGRFALYKVEDRFEPSVYLDAEI